MNKNRRILLAALALALCAALTASALAEGALGTLYRSATRLLFETDNATLSAKASFSYNGVPFKTMDGKYVQDGTRSLMDLKLKTTAADGSQIDSGFLVTAMDGTAYSIEPAFNPYVYQTSSCRESSAVLSSTLMRRTLLRLGSAVVDAAEGTFADHIETASAEGGTRYHLTLARGESPALVNAAGTLLARLAAERYYYLDYNMDESLAYWEQNGVEITYMDYDATFAALYEKKYGEKLPEDFYETMWNGDGSENDQVYTRYREVTDIMNKEIVDPLEKEYQSGVAVILEDGSVKYYAQRGEYIVENGMQQVSYADFDAAIRSYYLKKTGRELRPEMLDAIYSSNNEELLSAFYEMYDEMEQEYLLQVQADGKAPVIHVRADGSTQMIYDYDAYIDGLHNENVTVIQRILHTMEALELGNTDVEIVLDGQDRLVSASGTAEILVVDGSDHRSSLEITFEAAAGQYGESKVEDFDPDQYGVISIEKFWNEYDGDMTRLQRTESVTVQETPMPETVEFNGETYTVWLEDSGENG